MRKKFYCIILATFLSVLTACGNDSSDSLYPSEPTMVESTENSTPERDDPLGEISDEYFETTGYFKVDGQFSYYYQLVKNNYNETVRITGDTIVYDASGNELKKSNSSSSITIGPGDTGLLTYSFYNCHNIDHTETSFSATVNTDYIPYTSSIQFKILDDYKNEGYNTCVFTNTGNYIADRIDLFALYFYSDGVLMDVSDECVYNISPGASDISNTLKKPNNYAYAEYYCIASTKMETPDESINPDRDIRIEKQYEMNGYYFYVLRNISSKPLYVTMNMFAYDAYDNLIGARFGTIPSLGEGETPVEDIDFRDLENIDHVKYSFECETPKYDPYINKLDLEYTVSNTGVTISLTNNNEKEVRYVTAYAFFFDIDNHIKNIAWKTFMNEKKTNSIAPGSTLSVDLSPQGEEWEFDHVEVYIDGGTLINSL